MWAGMPDVFNILRNALGKISFQVTSQPVKTKQYRSCLVLELPSTSYATV